MSAVRRPALRVAQHRALGRKVSDEFTVPLCRGHHREAHRCGDEAAWWENAGVDPTITAQSTSSIERDHSPIDLNPNALKSSNRSFRLLYSQVIRQSVAKLDHRTKHEKGDDGERGVVYLGIPVACSLQRQRVIAGSPTAIDCRSNERPSVDDPLLAGMPPHPTPQTRGGWYFDIPTAPNSVHYVLAAVNMAASSSVDASILVTTTETPLFVYNLQPDNTSPIRRMSDFCCRRKVTIYRERTASNTLDGGPTA